MADVQEPEDEDLRFPEAPEYPITDDSVLDRMRDSGVGVVDPNITDAETPEIVEEDIDEDPDTER